MDPLLLLGGKALDVGATIGGRFLGGMSTPAPQYAASSQTVGGMSAPFNVGGLGTIAGTLQRLAPWAILGLIVWLIAKK